MREDIKAFAKKYTLSMYQVHFRYLENMVLPNETVIFVCPASISKRNGIFVVTSKKAIFISCKLLSYQSEIVNLKDISNIGTLNSILNNILRIHTSSKFVDIKTAYLIDAINYLNIAMSSI